MIKLTQLRLMHALKKKLGKDWDVFVTPHVVVACTNVDSDHMLGISFLTRGNEIIAGLVHEEKGGASRSPLSEGSEGDGWKLIMDATYDTKTGTENNLPENGKQAAAAIRSEFNRIGWAYWKSALHLS